jgi:hypothetical protein
MLARFGRQDFLRGVFTWTPALKSNQNRLVGRGFLSNVKGQTAGDKRMLHTRLVVISRAP